MSSDVPPIARIRLARSRRRLIALPVVLVLIGAASAAGAWRADGLVAIALAIAGVLIMLAGLLVAAILLSVRLEVTEAGIRLRWLGGERVYVLARGAVTRVALRGRTASPLRPSLGAFGWALGGARLRGTEAVDVVLLAAAPSAIVVPTEGRRLAIGVADEKQLLDAVATAARARQRLEDLGRRAQAAVPPAPAQPAHVEAPQELTGIERAEIEERLAAERAAVQRALAERQAAEAAAAAVAAAAKAPAAAERRGPAATATGVAAGAPRPAGTRRRLPLPGARAAALIVPLLATGAVWGAIQLGGRLATAEPGRLRLAVLALVLAGPGAALGALMARIWWPRLVGVVAVTALCALLIAGQALLLD